MDLKGLGDVACVILAAGASTRMKSDTPKVLHDVCGRPLLGHILNTVESLGLRRIVVVAGAGEQRVRRYAQQRAEVVHQHTPRGTGHALLQTRSLFRGFKGSLLVLCGDAPLIKGESLRKLVKAGAVAGKSCSVLSFVVEDPKGYGRIIRKGGRRVTKIVEELNASESEKTVREVNSGVYCFRAKRLFEVLSGLRPDPVKKEIYLTDAVEIFAAAGKAAAIKGSDPDEMTGVNSRRDLAGVTAIKKKNILDRIMDGGVTVVDPATTYIEEGVRIGRDTVIYPNTVIEGPAKIGAHCKIGPFARIRPEVVLADGVTVGNFVEVVRTRIGRKSLVKHLTYLGDTEVGSGANIGAGTITANYDGKHKHKTVIGDSARIGSGTVFVAPVRVGKRGVTGAGAILTRGCNVPAGSTAAGVPAKILKSQKKRKGKR